MFNYSHNGSPSVKRTPESSKMKSGRYWENSNSTPDRENYADHLRSSSYHLLHSQQHVNSSGNTSYHSRQPSNTSNYSESEELMSRSDIRHPNSSYSSAYSSHRSSSRSQYLSYDSIGPESSNHKYHPPWNMSEPDLSNGPHSTPNSYYPHNSHSNFYQQPKDNRLSSTQVSANGHYNSLEAHSSPSNLHSTVNSSYTSPAHPPPPPLRQSSPASLSKHPSSPPPPPVRDASSLKYIKYGPGHEKFPSWPVPAGSANQVMNSVSEHESSSHALSDSLSGPQGSHRSKSWTEQSDYPKDTSGGYTRPHHKKHLSPSYQQHLKTVIEKSEKIPPHLFESKLPDDLSAPNCSLMDSFCPNGSPYYPLYDRDGHGIDDKDYNIPSPPERDPGMGESFRGQLTAAQLEEYARHCDFSYNSMHGITPLLDQLREESAGWDGGSEKDSGRGESESMTDSFRYSNGRESVTTVVTNSSSASSSETLKWHGSLSDISVMSGQSRDTRAEQNIAHSSRVLAPQRHNSESILYYASDKNRKSSGAGRFHGDHRSKDGNRSHRETDSGASRLSRDSRWTREVERNNEVNNLKKFPSYSYSQPLSQINEAPVAESRECTPSESPPVKSLTIDISKPPSVAERISELERQSRKPLRDQSQRYREASEPRERVRSRDGKSDRDGRRRDLSEPRKEFRDEEEDASENCVSKSVKNNDSFTTHNNSINSIVGQMDPRIDSSFIARTLPSKQVDKSLPLPNKPLSTDIDQANSIQENATATSNSNSSVFHEDEKRPLKNFAYLDPKKQCKVPDSTLKSIQKKALLSFYERRTGKSVSSSSIGSEVASDQHPPLSSKNSFSSKSGSNIREGRSGLAGVSLARLGRVPEPEWDSPSRPPRKRSVHGRVEPNKFEESKDGCESVRSSVVSESSLGSTGVSPYPVPKLSVSTIFFINCRLVFFI